MNVYRVGGTSKRRYLNGGIKSLVPKGQEHRRCSSCGASLDYPPPESYWKNIYLDQGNFVSDILWEVFHVTDDLKEAFQNEGFEGLAFEPTEIVEDRRPSKDRNKLPFGKIPQFYRVKLLTSIPLHHDFIELYDVKSCPECGRTLSKHQIEPFILDWKRLPGTDFFRVVNDVSGKQIGFSVQCCSERGKAFLESYPKTFCRFTQCELRD